MNAPLVLTADPELRDALLRLAAAAGATPAVVASPADALRWWATAPVVLVGADLAVEAAGLAPPRRDHVHVLALRSAEHDLFRVALALGAESVVCLPQSDGWVVEALTDVGDVRPRGLVVGVVGGSGGAGATTFACAMAQVAALRGDTLVVDCDPLGPGVDRVLGLDGVDGFRWDALCQTTGRLSATALRQAVPRRARLGALSWHAGREVPTLQAFAVREALSAARRGHDTVVVDLPRAADPVVDEVAGRCDVLVTVVVPTLLGVASAARLCGRQGDRAPRLLVLRGLGHDERAVARAVGAPVVTSMGEHRGVAESVDLGLGPLRAHRGALWKASGAVLDGLDAVLAAPAGAAA